MQNFSFYNMVQKVKMAKNGVTSLLQSAIERICCLQLSYMTQGVSDQSNLGPLEDAITQL